MENYLFFAFSIIVLIVIFLLIKKLAGCIVKTAILIIVAAILAFVYFNYFTVVSEDNDIDIEQTEN